MTTGQEHKEHRKHARLPRPKLGEWGRAELALLGAPCKILQDFSQQLIRHFSTRKIAFIDADHHTDEAGAQRNALYLTEKTGGVQVDMDILSSFGKHALLNDRELVLVNGNHFTAQQQVAFIDPEKSLETKTERLTDVILVLLKDDQTTIPDYLHDIIKHAPVLSLNDTKQVYAFFEQYLQQQIAPLNGLVLAGGKSLRMGTDKSLLAYHSSPQRNYVFDMLGAFCSNVYLSANEEAGTLPVIRDRFTDLGPMSGILSAFQSAPDSAWLTVACDLPYLTPGTLEYLVQHRNASRMATAFMNAENTFPEPLITIWEPRAYPVLLQALSEGLSCPRKVLINSDIALLSAPDNNELQNVNDVAAYEKAVAHFNSSTS